ncbi:hypothetical protein Ancab_026917 [Ancistrocladus abbreviatus]
METPTPTVDTSSPFRSVKEAVARFNLAGNVIPLPKLPPIAKDEAAHKFDESRVALTCQNDDHNSNDEAVENILKKLVAELEETKMEIKLLKERESETEVALASLNAQLHRNMSKMAEAEAAEAAKAAAIGQKDDGRKRDIIGRAEEFSPITLGQVLRFDERDEVKLMKRKKKPIIPLVTDIFVWKKEVT